MKNSVLILMMLFSFEALGAEDLSIDHLKQIIAIQQAEIESLKATVSGVIQGNKWVGDPAGLKGPEGPKGDPGLPGSKGEGVSGYFQLVNKKNGKCISVRLNEPNFIILMQTQCRNDRQEQYWRINKIRN